MPVQPRKAMCSSAWAEPGNPGGVSSPPTLKLSSTVTTGASALRTITTCSPLGRVARVTLSGSAACRKGPAANRNNKGSSFTQISPVGSSFSFQWGDIDSYPEAVLRPSQQDPSYWTHVTVISSPCQRDMSIGWNAIVGGIEINPAEARAPGGAPGM